MAIDINKFGNWLKRRRQLLDMTQQDLADGVNYSLETIRKIENSHRRPSKELAISMAKILEIPDEQVDIFITFARMGKGHTDITSIVAELNRQDPLYFRDTHQRSEDGEEEGQSAVFQAPSEDTVFIGRTEEFKKIQKILLKGNRICFIQGMPGVGKTRLATRAAYQLSSHFPDGVLWGDAKDRSSVTSILQLFATAFGQDVSIYTDDENRSAHVRALLRTKRCLIVLDGVGDASILKLLIPSHGNCSVLVTTTIQISAPEFNANSVEINTFELIESTQLLSRLISPLRVQAEPEATKLLFSLVGGLPLALKLIGSALSHATSLSLADYALLLQEEYSRLGLLDQSATSPNRLQATFDVNYNLLEEHLQIVFAHLGVFQANSFSSEAVAAIHQQPLSLIKLYLAKLQAYSFIENHQSRYRIHTLLRIFAYKKLSSRVTIIWPRFIHYYASFCKEATYNDIDAEWENIVGGIKAEVESNKLINQLSMLSPEGVGYIDSRGKYKNGYLWLDSIVQPDDAGEHFCKLGILSFRLNNFLKAKEYFAQAEEQNPAVLVQAQIWEFQARILMDNDPEIALSLIEKGIILLKAASTLPEKQQLGALHVVASTIWARKYGDLIKSRDHAKESIQLLGAKPSTNLLSSQLNLGIINVQEGNLVKADKIFEESIQAARELGDRRQLANHLMNHGIVARRISHLQKALDLQTEAATIYRDIENVDREGSTYVNKAMTYFMLEEDELAENILISALSLAKKNKLDDLEAFASLTLARVYIRKKQLDEAEQLIETSYAYCSSQGAGAELLPSALYIRAALCYEQKRFPQGIAYAREAIEIAKRNGFVADEGIACYYYARLQDKQENYDVSEDLYKTAINLLEDQDPYELAMTYKALSEHYGARFGEKDSRYLEYQHLSSERLQLIKNRSGKEAKEK